MSRSRSTSTRFAAVPSGMHSQLFYGRWARTHPRRCPRERPLRWQGSGSTDPRFALEAHSPWLVRLFFLVPPTARPSRDCSFHRARRATCTSSARSTRRRGAPPRGVTVSAGRWDESGAARRQKRRRHFPPSHRLWLRSSRPHVSATHAPSRRLQRVSLSCTRVSRGQAPRRRPLAGSWVGISPTRSLLSKDVHHTRVTTNLS